MTTLLVPETGEVQADDATPACGCCIPPPDTARPDGRQRALAELSARREALQRRLEGLR